MHGSVRRPSAVALSLPDSPQTIVPVPRGIEEERVLLRPNGPDAAGPSERPRRATRHAPKNSLTFDSTSVFGTMNGLSVISIVTVFPAT